MPETVVLSCDIAGCTSRKARRYTIIDESTHERRTVILCDTGHGKALRELMAIGEPPAAPATNGPNRGVSTARLLSLHRG